MTTPKKRKKVAATVTTAAPNSEPAVAVLDMAPLEDAEDFSPVMQAEIARDALQAAQRPAWIDGAPVTTEGQFIREGSSRPTSQIELAADEAPQEDSHAGDRQPGKNWGDPYKSIFSCREMGFELGENRRFKQRVFLFNGKPADDILTTLKEQGFTYRAAEKAWTIPANPATRKLTDELARIWAGPNYIQSVER